MDTPKKYFVYCHTNTVSGKSYIGVTSASVKKRWRQHVTATKRGSQLAFHKAIRCHGESTWLHEVLESMTTRAGAYKAEVLWISRRETIAPKGYNLTSGGICVDLAEESKARRTATLKETLARPEVRARRIAALDDMRNNPEIKQKLNKAVNEARAKPEYVAKQVNSSHKMGLRSNNTSGFKGVCRQKQNRNWLANIKVGDKSMHIGCFPTAEEAARAYDAAAIAAWGRGNCYLNFPELHSQMIASSKKTLATPDSKAKRRATLSAKPGKPNTSSKFKGVSLHKPDRKWMACIKVNGKNKNLGMYKVEEEAARAYDRAAMEVWGPGCYQNFPDTN